MSDFIEMAEKIKEIQAQIEHALYCGNFHQAEQFKKKLKELELMIDPKPEIRLDSCF